MHTAFKNLNLKEIQFKNQEKKMWFQNEEDI